MEPEEIDSLALEALERMEESKANMNQAIKQLIKEYLSSDLAIEVKAESRSMYNSNPDIEVILKLEGEEISRDFVTLYLEQD